MFIIFVCFRFPTACRFRQNIKNFVNESWRSRVVLFRNVGRDRFREKKKDRCLMGRLVGDWMKSACGIITVFSYENDLHSWLVFPLPCSVSSGVREHKALGYFLFITTCVVVWHILHFHPQNWGNDPIWRAYFFRWVVQPQTRRSPSHVFASFDSFPNFLEMRTFLLWAGGAEATPFAIWAVKGLTRQLWMRYIDGCFQK